MKKKPAFRVVSAKYGAYEITAVDVTEAVQVHATSDGLVMKVTNANLGVDPSPNVRKRLWVTYKHGTVKDKATSIEGTTIRIGQGA